MGSSTSTNICQFMIYYFTVVTAHRPTCYSSQPIVTYGSEGYISSLIAKKTGCGSSKAPWKIEVLPGQQINISIISFDKQVASSHGINNCVVKG